MKKDPRTLSDKSVQQGIIRKLIAFLSEHNYPKSYTPRALQTPTSKEFLYIFNFLLEILDQQLMIDGMNIVEEVPRTLKLLGYPFTISKNHLLNVGSPHSWPILLGALSFLVDCCKIPDNSSQILFSEGTGFSDEPSTSERQFEVEACMYKAFMYHGQDSPEYSEMVEQRTEAARKQLEFYSKDIERLAQENAELTERTRELSTSSIQTLKQHVQQNEHDYQELSNYLTSDLSTRIEHLETACTDAEAQASHLEVQIESAEGQTHQLEAMVRSQSMSAAEAVSLHQSIHDAEDFIEKNRTSQDSSSQRIGELQMQHNKNVAVIDEGCCRVNDVLRRLAAILPDAGTLQPLDYDTSRRSDPDILASLEEYARILRHELQALQQCVAGEVSELESDIISGETTQSALHNEQVKKQLEIDNVQHTLDIEKETLEQKKRSYEEGMKLEQTKKHGLEKQLMAYQQQLQGDSTATKELQSFKKQAEEERRAMVAEVHEQTVQVQAYIRAVCKFIEALEQNKSGVRKDVEELVKKFQQLKIPTIDSKYLPRTHGQHPSPPSQ